MNIRIVVGDVIYEYVLKNGKDVPEGIYSATVSEVDDDVFYAYDENFPDKSLMYAKDEYGKKWFMSKEDAKAFKVKEAKAKIDKLMDKIYMIGNM